MFRLFKAELKKIFMKPSIFVVTGLIIIMLALSFFLYNPAEKKSYLDIYTGGAPTGATVETYYNQYFNSDESNSLSKQAKNNISDAQAYIDFYETFDDETNGIAFLKERWADVQKAYDDYQDAYMRNQSKLPEYRQNLQTKIQTFSTLYSERAKSKTNVYFLVKESVDDSIQNDYLYNLKLAFDKIDTSAGVSADQTLIGSLIGPSKVFDTSKSKGKMSTALDTLVSFKPNANLLTYLQTYIDTANSRLTEQSNTIINYYNENRSSKQTKEFRTILTNYVLTSKYAKNIVMLGVQSNGFADISNSSVKSYKNCEKIDTYQLQIDYNQTKYLFDNEQYDYQFATPFSLTEASNQTINGFDYSYYALRLCSLFITVYLVVLAAGTIAGEQSAGTLKLLAIRPYSRSKLLVGKSLATFAIGGILLLVSAVASLVIGLASYGLNSANIMAVFNGASVVVLNPFVLYLIAFLTMFVEILFYASLSICISTAFKSNVGAVSISTLIFFVSLIINGATTGVSVLGFLPFTNISFFKYFGSAFMQNGTPTIFSMILSPAVFVDSTFWSSFAIYLISLAVLIIIPHIVFKKRDLK